MKSMGKLTFNRNGFWCATYSPDGKSILAGTSDSKLFKVTPGSKQVQAVDLTEQIGQVGSVTYSPNKDVVFVSGQKQQVAMLNGDLKVLQVIPSRISLPSAVKQTSRCIQFSPNGGLVAVSYHGGGFSLIDALDSHQASLLTTSDYNPLLKSVSLS